MHGVLAVVGKPIYNTPSHNKRTDVPTKCDLTKARSISAPHCRREAEDDKFCMPPPPPHTTVRIIDVRSLINNYEYCTNCNLTGHMKIMCPFHLKNTCRKCGQPGHNIITCGRPPKKAVRPQNLKPAPEHTPSTPGPSNLHLIQKGKRGNFSSQCTPDNFETLSHNQPCKHCKGNGHQTFNCYIMHTNSRNTIKSTNQKNALRANQPVQLALNPEVEPDLSIAQWMVNNQVCQEYEELIRRDSKWSTIFKRLRSGEKITGAKVVDGFLYLLHISRWQLVIPDHFNIKSKPAKEFLINQAHVNTGHAG